MLVRFPAELWGFGEPWAPERGRPDPDSGDMRGDVYIGGVSGFVARPDMGGLWWGLAGSGADAGSGELSWFGSCFDATIGDLGGDLGFTFLYRAGGSLGEGRFSGTMNRSRSLSQSTGSMSGADSLVV